MSEKPVEERITEITSQDLFFLHYWLAPVIIGVGLAVLAPYFQLCIGLAHSKAVEYKDNEIKRLREIQERDAADIRNLQNDLYQDTEKRAKLANVELELIESRKATCLAYQDLRKKRYDGQRENLEKELVTLKEKIAYASEQKRITDKSLEATLHSQDLIAQRLNDITKVYYEFEQLTNPDDFAEFLSVLSKTEVLKLDHLDDNFRKMMERETLLKMLRDSSSSNDGRT